MPEGYSRRSWMLVLAYLPLLGLIPLLASRQDREVRWHARNGLFLFVSVALVGAASTIIGIVIPRLSCLYGIAMLVVLVVYTVIVILAIVKALGGERLIVPGISSYADRG
jgi:uncharacterized membrane protein